LNPETTTTFELDTAEAADASPETNASIAATTTANRTTKRLIEVS
jgi:hypothetical protein